MNALNIESLLLLYGWCVFTMLCTVDNSVYKSFVTTLNKVWYEMKLNKKKTKQIGKTRKSHLFVGNGIIPIQTEIVALWKTSSRCRIETRAIFHVVILHDQLPWMRAWRFVCDNWTSNSKTSNRRENGWLWSTLKQFSIFMNILAVVGNNRLSSARKPASFHVPEDLWVRMPDSF